MRSAGKEKSLPWCFHLHEIVLNESTIALAQNWKNRHYDINGSASTPKLQAFLKTYCGNF